MDTFFYDGSVGSVRKAKSSWQIKDAFENGRIPLVGAKFDPPPTSLHKLGTFVEDYEYVSNSGDLDECNGMTDVFGNYGYYYTDDYPYGPVCSFGQPDSSFTKSSSEYSPGSKGNVNGFSFVVSNSNEEHGHVHGINSTPSTAGATQYVSSSSVVAIAATGAVVIGVL